MLESLRPRHADESDEDEDADVQADTQQRPQFVLGPEVDEAESGSHGKKVEFEHREEVQSGTQGSSEIATGRTSEEGKKGWKQV